MAEPIAIGASVVAPAACGRGPDALRHAGEQVVGQMGGLFDGGEAGAVLPAPVQVGQDCRVWLPRW